MLDCVGAGKSYSVNKEANELISVTNKCYKKESWERRGLL